MTHLLRGVAISAALSVAAPVWAQVSMTSEDDLNRQELNRLTAPATVQPITAMPPQHSVQSPANPVASSPPPHPASWYYDPYTSGSAPCPEGGETGRPIKCDALIPQSTPLR
jgi:hypothetical protein